MWLYLLVGWPNIPNSELHSVCEVSMASISLFYVFFFQIEDHVNSFQLQESHYSRKDNGKKYLPVNGEMVQRMVQRMYHLYVQRNEPEVSDRQQSILM